MPRKWVLKHLSSEPRLCRSFTDSGYAGPESSEGDADAVEPDVDEAEELEDQPGDGDLIEP